MPKELFKQGKAFNFFVHLPIVKFLLLHEASMIR